MRILRTVIMALVAAAAVVVAPGSASAAEIVPPGGSGNTCSGYAYVTSVHRWQTCAWADNNEVYFTVNFSNTGNTPWVVDKVWVDYFRSGTRMTCGAGAWENFTVPATSVRGTPTAACAIPRRSAAYASIGQVWDGNYYREMHSPTLQVQ